MAPPVYVSSGWYGTHSGSPATKSTNVGNVAVGDLVVVCVQQISGRNPNPDYAVSDSLGNTYTRAEFLFGASSRYIETWYTIATVAGSCTFSVTQTPGGSVAWTTQWVTYTPASGTSIAFDAVSSFNNAANVTTHYTSAVGEINTSSDVAVVLSWINANGPGTVTTPSGYTVRQTALTNRGYLLTQETSTPLVADRGVFLTTVSLASAGITASFKSVSSAAPTNFVSDWW